MSTTNPLQEYEESMMEEGSLKAGQIYIAAEGQTTAKSFGLVRVAGWLPDKKTLLFQMMTPYERLVTCFGTKYGFKKQDYYLYPFSFGEFRKQFRQATREDVIDDFAISREECVCWCHQAGSPPVYGRCGRCASGHCAPEERKPEWNP